MSYHDVMDKISNGIVDMFNRDFPWNDTLADLETHARTAMPSESALSLWDRWSSEPHEVTVNARLPLMNPFHVLLIIVAYLLIVGVGCFLMSFKKEPFKPRALQIVHNLFLVALSAFMTLEALRQAYVIGGYSLVMNPIDRSEKGVGMARIVWIFYASKIAEFMDTFIMVLKKSTRQISFLHLYHHTTIFAIWWMVTFYGPGGDAYLSVVLNSFVHVVMYSYYLSTTLKVPLLWIKPYITTLQMSQFVLMMSYATYDLIRNEFAPIDYPPFLGYVLVVYMWTLLALFFNFFRQDQKRRRALRAQQQKKRQ